MTQYRTIFNIKRPEFEIEHNDKLIFFGSCFSQNIGSKFQSSKFQVNINPFGILFNPVSVSNSIEILINQNFQEEKNIRFYNGLWNSFLHHSSFSNTSKEILLNKINERITQSNLDLLSCNYLFLTFGTAYVYRYLESGEIVSNCHKLPSTKFRKELLKVEEIVGIYKKLISKLSEENSEIKIIFTLSPVRHMSDGAHENQISKAVLLLAINEIIENCNNCWYFPAYELVLDDLRDYRFYDTDMLHPSALAIEYIWERFSDTLFSEETIILNKQIEQIRKACEHRPFNPNTDLHRSFQAKTFSQIHSLQSKFPSLDFTEEIISLTTTEAQ